MLITALQLLSKIRKSGISIVSLHSKLITVELTCTKTGHCEDSVQSPDLQIGSACQRWHVAPPLMMTCV